MSADKASNSSIDLEKSQNNKDKLANIENFTKDGFKILMESIRHGNKLPFDRDYNFYNSHESFRKIIGNESNHILTLINKILQNYGIKNNIKSSIFDHKTELLIEGNDVILEKVANYIDEMDGIKKNVIEPMELQGVTESPTINGSWNRIRNSKFSQNPSSSTHIFDNEKTLKTLLSSKNIVKPQKNFMDKIDNSNLYPWEPRIKDKPNSIKPLAIFLEETTKGEEYTHPYELELEKFTPSQEQLDLSDEEPTFPVSLSETKFVQVDNIEKLHELIEDLKNYKEIAIDLEHHSYRTFMGITCLMQISTDHTDYIIDTLILREQLHLLNEIFTKPSILKIFHGADSDILWLQRDLSLYIVNMFDTHQAAIILEYANLSLSSLLERFCKFKPNKHFQLADWRIRPLSDALKNYAREDTHYLIFIYRILKKELIKKAGGNKKLLSNTYLKSTEICKTKYFKPRWTEESHLDLYKKCKRIFDNRQLYALKEIHKWRDQTAREEDESVGYVLPNHMLLQISETLPREMQGILACCNPIPPLVRSNLLEIHHIVLKAREMSLEKPILQKDVNIRSNLIQFDKLNIDSPLHCPHDSTKCDSSKSNLPTLFSTDSIRPTCNNISVDKTLHNEKSQCIFSIFAKCKQKINVQRKITEREKCLTPYERYQFVKSFLQYEEMRNTKHKDTLEKDKDETVNKVENKEKESEEISTIHIEDPALRKFVQTEHITLIRDYFTTLTNKTKENEELAIQKEKQLYERVAQIEQERIQSLTEMGGTKRKRQEPHTDESYTKEPKNFLRSKRKKNDTNVDSQKSKITKQNRRRNKKKSQPGNFKGKDKQKNNQNITSVQKETGDIGSSKLLNENSLSKKECFNKSPENSRKNGKRKRESDKQFEAFDYTSIDFRQFQGGVDCVNQAKPKYSFKKKGKHRSKNKEKTSF